MSRLDFTLLENGLDYFIKALDHLESKEDKELKYAVRDLHSGVSLVLKERLRRQHWSLLFDKVDDADEEKLKQGHFQSVDLKDSILRLNQLEDDLVEPDFESVLYLLRYKRNLIEHYTISDRVNSIRSLIYRVLKHSLDFISNKLEIRSGEYDEEISVLRERIYSYNSYRKKRLKEIETDLESFEVVFKCPECLNESFPLDQENRSCLFCFHKDEDGESLAYSYRTNVLLINDYAIAKARQDEVLENCYECGTESLVLNFSDNGHACFECSEVYPIGHFDWCSRCGQVMRYDGENCVCSDCWQNLWDKD